MSSPGLQSEEGGGAEVSGAVPGRRMLGREAGAWWSLGRQAWPGVGKARAPRRLGSAASRPPPGAEGPGPARRPRTGGGRARCGETGDAGRRLGVQAASQEDRAAFASEAAEGGNGQL